MRPVARTTGETAALRAAEAGADRRVHAARLAAQLLVEPARDPVAVAERLLAIQGQDARGARLAVRARTTGQTAADVDRALTDDRTLLMTWLNRGTLHLVRSEDYWWLHKLTVRAGYQVGCRRILARLGIEAGMADEAARTAEKALLADGPLTSAQLAERLAAAGLPASGGAGLHTLMLACLEGNVVRGPMIGGQHAYVHVRDWLGDPPPLPDPAVALGWLARRYLAGHGPACDRDLAKWAGITLGDARRGLSEIAASLRDRPDGLAQITRGPEPDPELPSARLLGPFDPVLLGWASRDPVLGDHKRIVTVNGLFRPFVLVAGRAAGTWTWAGGQVKLDLPDTLPAMATAELAAEAADIRRFLVGAA